MSSPDAQPSHAQYDTRFFGHPRGLATLFFTEMWERFSYYGMRAILIYYMTDKIVQGRAGLQRRQSRRGLRPLYRHGLPAVPGRRMGGRPHRRATAGRAPGRPVHRRRRVLPDGAQPRPRSICGLVLLMVGTGLLKGNVSTIVGPALPAGRSAARFRLLHFLHGDQYRRSDFPDLLRLGGRDGSVGGWVSGWPAWGCWPASFSMCSAPSTWAMPAASRIHW